RNLGRITFGECLDRLSTHNNAVFGRADLLGIAPQNAVVLEQMSHRGDVAEIVESNHLDVVAAGLYSTEEVAADSTEAVHTYPNGHCSTLLMVRPGDHRDWGVSGCVQVPLTP